MFFLLIQNLVSLCTCSLRTFSLRWLKLISMDISYRIRSHIHKIPTYCVLWRISSLTLIRVIWNLCNTNLSVVIYKASLTHRFIGCLQLLVLLSGHIFNQWTGSAWLNLFALVKTGVFIVTSPVGSYLPVKPPFISHIDKSWLPSVLSAEGNFSTLRLLLIVFL